MTRSDGDKTKTAGICDSCSELFTVWACQDGTVRPVSPHNACSCDDPSYRVVKGNEVFDDDDEAAGANEEKYSDV
ncbi:hypothetical protein [Natrinema pallidum]|uniref:Uncharacterized protein n=2 Tax=Natrinema pallidum TaxID=69527 RepID=L9YG78_9EURY|nr:hypothetical protein [Natrinema pallidum]ELY73120.1 hypothetical protein C487_17940 [Natrinema pallidum DSM 3751]QCW04209.1 hypothetical protein FGF80_13650 [Natrinema pallidum]